MKIKVASSYSGKIQTGDYSNANPSFFAEVEYELPGEIKAENLMEILSEEQKQLNMVCYNNWKRVEENIRIEKIKKDRADFHWYKSPDGKEYPSVTSILNYDTDFSVPEHELKQYAAQGSIIHLQVDHFIKTGMWLNPEDIPEAVPYRFIIEKGELGLSLGGWDFPAFLEKHPLIDMKPGEPMTNKRYEYGGLPDISFCVYEGKPTICEIKRTADKEKDLKHYQQLAAYANLDGAPKVEQMMIIPLNDKTKQGFSSPRIETRIDHYFQMFLFKRKQFRTVYGI